MDIELVFPCERLVVSGVAYTDIYMQTHFHRKAYFVERTSFSLSCSLASSLFMPLLLFIHHTFSSSASLSVEFNVNGGEYRSLKSLAYPHAFMYGHIDREGTREKLIDEGALKRVRGERTQAERIDATLDAAR